MIARPICLICLKYCRIDLILQQMLDRKYPVAATVGRLSLQIIQVNSEYLPLESFLLQDLVQEHLVYGLYQDQLLGKIKKVHFHYLT